MVRDAGIMKLLPGAMVEYKKRHDKIWPELIESIKSPWSYKKLTILRCI